MRLKQLSLSLVIVLLTVSSFAQQPSKMNFDLARKAYNPSLQNEVISVLVKGNIDGLKSVMRELGGKFNYSAGDIASVTLSVKNIALLSHYDFVNRIEASVPHVTLMSDSMRMKANVDQVHSGQAPLPQGYDGSGVVVGIIDSGTDFNNPDFKDSNGKTRIKFLWDHTKANASNTPQPYNYGQEWDNTKIDLGQCTHDDAPHSGHGTVSSGIAAGNGSSSTGNKYKGVAPKADLIVVAYNFNNPKPNSIADAVDYIYAKAQILGKPCVINLSLGDYYGSHDGKDLQAQLMNNLLKGANGRAMTASSGNAGGKFLHLGYSASSTDTNFTWFKRNNSFLGGPIDMVLYGEKNTFKNIKFSVGADKVTPYYSFRGQKPFTDVTQYPIQVPQSSSLMNGANKLGTVYTYADSVGGVYSMEFYIEPDSTSYNWRLSITGSGRFDLWAYDPTRPESTEMEYKTLPSVSTFPPIAKYKVPDTLQNICSSFQCLDNVVTVGNFNNRRTYIGYNSILQMPYPGIKPGYMDISSSIGPTRDGRIKPDIAAPGALTMTSGVMSTMTAWQTTAPQNLDETGVNVRAGGTSASAPVVAGIAALYLQKNPTASATAVKNAILACPTVDTITKNLPNSIWGYGKVNAFTTLAGCTVGTANSISGHNVGFDIYPNPFNDHATIAYDLSAIGNYSTAHIRINDIVGKQLNNINLTDKISTITLSKELFQNGCYFYSLLIDGKIIRSGKLVVLE